MPKHHETHRTHAETILASALRKMNIQPLQNQFIEGFEVDLLIPKFNLIIEVDGFIHLSQTKKESDNYKDHCLITKGYSVFRFDNQQIREHLSECLKIINNYINNFKELQRHISINEAWKEPLKDIHIPETKSRPAPKSIEDFFLSLDNEE